ncbi:MAG: hypothetical protein JO227_21105 [Acetobacteraceae bacterium]|nr:hypothetical protein [Acetobacteraceae bacterium]
MAPADITPDLTPRFSIDCSKPLPDAGAGMRAFAAKRNTDSAPGFMAIEVHRHVPPRAGAIQSGVSIEGVLMPVAYGIAPGPNGQPACFVITAAPPGPSVGASLRPWHETALFERVLRPCAMALEQLRTNRLTHRGIRPDNVFQRDRLQPVVLGASWAAPAAMHQPAVFEPPYSAMCLPAGKGEGSIADDVYSLGVLLLTLALGRMPLAGLDDATVLRRKLELGCYAALTENERVPGAIAELVRGMLATDPAHRPAPALLLDLQAARGRRVASRFTRRAQHPLIIGGNKIWDARTAAYELAMQPQQANQELLGGNLVRWLRRDLADADLAARMAEVIAAREQERGDPGRIDAAARMRGVSLLDPLAPVCWGGIAFWPDGLGSALAATKGGNPAEAKLLEDAIASEATAEWACMRPERCDPAPLQLQARRHRSICQMRTMGGGPLRLAYALNPLLPCCSPILANDWVAQLGDLVPALERAAAARPAEVLIDAEIAAFMSARAGPRLQQQISALSAAAEEERAVVQARVLASVQARLHSGPMPAVAKWFAEQASSRLAQWRNPERRAQIAEHLEIMAQGGQLAPMVALLEDPFARDQDAREAAAASRALARLDAELARMGVGSEEAKVLARRIGQEVAAGASIAVLVFMLLSAALG